MTTGPTNWIGLHLEGGRYQVTGQLGAGGMGQVYRARDTRLDTDVVLKVPHPHLLQNPLAAARFRREIRALVQLSHPHIVKVLDLGEHQGLPFVIMQFLAGGSLQDRLHFNSDGDCAPIPPEQLSHWLPDVADALDFMHSQGFVHRDVKPHNILFDQQGQAYLADFGLVKAVASAVALPQSDSQTAPGQLLGTPLYMAPELLMGTEFDGRLDQYALAVVVYQLLSGRLPFRGSTLAAIMAQHLTQPAVPLAQLRSSIPESISQVVSRAMAKKPAERFDSCTLFAQSLLTAFRTGSVLATPNLGATIPNPLAIHQPRVPARTGSGSVTAPVFPNAGRPMTRKRWVLGLAALIVLLSGIVALLVLPDSPFHTLWSGSADHQRTSTSQATEADSGARQPLAAHPTAKASPATPLAGTRPVPVATPEPAGGAIELWRVGSPKDPDLPPAKLPEAVAELLHELQITVRVRALSAADFPVEFRKAIAQGAPPDLIAGNNLLPFQEALADAEHKDSFVRCYGALQGLGTLVYLVTGSGQHATARQAALAATGGALPREQDYQGLAGQLKSPGDRNLLNDLNHTAMAAYITGNGKLLASLAHPDMIGKSGPFLDGANHPTVTRTRSQVFLGSPKLAFVLGTTTFSSAHQLGTVAVLSVWVRREDRWTLLAISNDPISVQGARTDLPRLAAALVPGNDAQLAPAELLAPADGVFPQAAPGQRFGDFIWRPSPSADVIGEVAEFAYSNGDRIVFQVKDRVSAGKLWTTNGEWSWRVWSIGKHGTVTFSSVRHFRQ